MPKGIPVQVVEEEHLVVLAQSRHPFPSKNDQNMAGPTINGWTSGGAQVAGERRSTAFTLASDLDYVRGRHSLRAGVLVDGASWHSNLNANYLGTFTFNSL